MQLELSFSTGRIRPQLESDDLGVLQVRRLGYGALNEDTLSEDAGQWPNGLSGLCGITR